MIFQIGLMPLNLNNGQLPTTDTEVALETNTQTTPNEPTGTTPTTEEETTTETSSTDTTPPPSIDDYEPTAETLRLLKNAVNLYNQGAGVEATYDDWRSNGFLTAIPGTVSGSPILALVAFVECDMAEYIRQINITSDARTRTSGEEEAKVRVAWIHENARRFLPHLLHTQGRLPDWALGLNFLGYRLV